jgi:hypothetical protein
MSIWSSTASAMRTGSPLMLRNSHFIILPEEILAEVLSYVIDIPGGDDLTAETRSLEARHDRRLRPSLGCGSLRFSALDGPESHSSCCRFQSGIPGPVRYGSRDFRGCSRKSGRPRAHFDVRYSHKNSHLTSIDESTQCRVTCCDYRRPRRLAWPRTPDFQSTGRACGFADFQRTRPTIDLRGTRTLSAWSFRSDRLLRQGLDHPHPEQCLVADPGARGAAVTSRRCQGQTVRVGPGSRPRTRAPSPRPLPRNRWS